MAVDQLTERQKDVLARLPATKDQLSSELGISGSTIESHVGNIRDVIGDRDAVVYDYATEEYQIQNEDLQDLADRLSDRPASMSTAPESGGGADEITVPDDLVDRLKAAGVTYDDLQENYGIEQDAGRRLFQHLREEGYRIDFKEINSNGKRRYYIPDQTDKRYRFEKEDGVYRFGLISDTHLGSKAEHLDDLNDFYDRLADRGIDLVLHAGDISEGWKVHRGQINELKGEASGWDRLTEYVVNNYPKRPGIQTLFISGNHDHKLHRRTGLYFGERVAGRRDDLHWLGDSQARIIFDHENDIDLELIHPSGGQPYTVGYRLQTLYRERSLDQRPTIAAVGHIHGSMYAKTEGVHGFYAGCWKGATTYGKRKGNQSAVGGWIVTLEIEDGELRRFVPEWIGYESDDTTANFDMTDVHDLFTD